MQKIIKNLIKRIAVLLIYLLRIRKLYVGCLLLQVLLNSKLPVDVLGRIWDLSDIDNDGFLDNEEFAVVC